MWTRWTAPLPAVAAVLADAVRLDAAMPAGWGLDVDADAWAAAWAGEQDVVDATLRQPWGARAWPMRVDEVVPGLRLTTTTSSGGDTLVHRRRLERTVGGGVRSVDEVVWSTPHSPRLTRRITQHVLTSMHHDLARTLPADPARHASVRWWDLGAGNADHAHDALSGLDLGAHRTR